MFTYIGLVLFLTGVNVGFMPLGYKMGASLAENHPAILVTFGLVAGILTVLAEPAVHVLNAQVEEVTGGLVQRNHLAAENVSAALSDGDVLSIRGKGKFRLETDGSLTRKGRVAVRILQYL